jgi:hypothetical protein
LRIRRDGEGGGWVGKGGAIVERAGEVFVIVIVGGDGFSRTVHGDTAAAGSGADAFGLLALFGLLVVTLEAARLTTAETVRRTYSMSVPSSHASRPAMIEDVFIG